MRRPRKLARRTPPPPRPPASAPARTPHRRRTTARDRARLVVRTEGAAGCEKAPLPSRGCAERERPLRRDRALPQVVTRRAAHERVPPEVQRQSPVRERTGGVGCHDVAERPTAFL